MSIESTPLTEHIEPASNALGIPFDLLEWGEDEISRSLHRRPHAADALHHSFMLIRPTSDRMRTEIVYRSHCRELLDRVANGRDTRRGTAVEVVIALCEVALATPINATATGLLFRMWTKAFPDQPEIDANQQHREALHGTSIDDAEAFARNKLTVPNRVLGTIACSGWHHGELVACIYAPQPLPADTETAPPGARRTA